MSNFSFIQTDADNILNLVHSLVPGISKVMSVSYSVSGEKPEVLFIDSPSPNSVIEKLDTDEKTIEKIESILKEKNPFAWYSATDIPFNIEKPKIKPLDVFDELEKNILVISVPNAYGNNNDLFIFYFNDDLSNFKITQSKKPLNQENKLIIGTLLFNSISTLLELVRNAKAALNSIKGNVGHVVEDMKSAQASIDSFQEKHEEMMLNYANESISELSESFGHITFSLSKNAIQKIKKYNGDLSIMKEALKNAMSFASSLCLEENYQKIVIDDFHINFVANKISEKKQILDPPASRQTKTLLFLDRLEEAANIVFKQNKPLTGVNVGKAFEKPISAPAISDALKNHQKTIRDLMNNNPQCWTLVRNQFKPLKNLLTTRFTDDDTYRKQA